MHGSSRKKHITWLKRLWRLVEVINTLLSLADLVLLPQTENPFPQLELEWMATTVFNHAIDLYTRNEDEPCRKWANKALEFAHISPDDGSLEKTLQKNYMSLEWEH